MKFTAEQAKHANYACASLSLIILVTRLAVSRRRQKPIDLSFYLVLLSLVVIITRIGVVFFYLLYGTASDALNNAVYFDTHDIDTVTKGTKLSLAARVLITSSCWLQICLLLHFYQNIMAGIRWVKYTIWLTWAATGGSFIAVVLATFLECRPLRLYWQVNPHPGSCVKGYVQLLVQCISNIGLDILLLIIAYPILFCSRRSWQQHIRIAVLFVLGTFCIIVTSLRLVSVYDSGSSQPTRSLWASVQIVVSTFVANAPTIYGDLQVAKRKKSDPIIRRGSRPEIWGTLDTVAALSTMLPPQRAVTNGSDRSSRKEWFDHLEDVDDVRSWQRMMSPRDVP